MRYQLYEYYDNRWHSCGVYNTRKECEQKAKEICNPYHKTRIATYKGRRTV